MLQSLAVVVATVTSTAVRRPLEEPAAQASVDPLVAASMGELEEQEVASPPAKRAVSRAAVAAAVTSVASLMVAGPAAQGNASSRCHLPDSAVPRPWLRIAPFRSPTTEVPPALAWEASVRACFTFASAVFGRKQLTPACKPTGGLHAKLVQCFPHDDLLVSS